MRLFFLVLTCLSLGGCSFNRMVVKQVGPMLNSASPELQKERNWAFFKAATPASLQFAEALLTHDPENRDFLALLTKGFASYGYVVSETEHLAERLANERQQPAREEAINSFSKSLDYGFRFLATYGLNFRDLQAADRDQNLKALLDQKLDPSSLLHRETLFFIGSSWLLLANYERNNLVIASQINLAFELIDWVCTHEPGFQSGSCQMMAGVFHLARPPMLGGKPDLARQLFKEASEQYPENFLIPVTFLEWFVVPRGDKEAYDKVMALLEPRLQKWRRQVYVPGQEAKPEDDELILNLFNAMAEKRLGFIKAAAADSF